jgi:hypothetical protein
MFNRSFLRWAASSPTVLSRECGPHPLFLNLFWGRRCAVDYRRFRIAANTSKNEADSPPAIPRRCRKRPDRPRVNIIDANGEAWEALYTLEEREDGSLKITGCSLLKVGQAA